MTRSRLPGWAPAAALAAICLAGVGLRLALVGQALLSDELATYWDVSARSVRSLLSTIHSDAEISPPLTFLLSWTGLKAGQSPPWIRAFSVLAGGGTIAAIYFLGREVSGRAAGLTAAGLTAFAPFMVFYSTEARGYGVAIALVTLSTLSMLIAVRDGRKRWWVAYAVATCAAAYTHYTCVFVLAFQLVWLLIAEPAARRPALLATGAAALAYVPWLSGLSADLSSPTTDILSALQPFTLHAIRTSLLHWSIGYPYSLVGVREIPGTPALVLLALAAGGAAIAVLLRARRTPGPALAARRSRVVLVVGLALAVPVGEALFSAVGSNLFSTRNLAASWPGFALALALLLVSAGPRLRMATAGLAVAALAIGAVKMLEGANSRPQFDQAAAFINAHSRRGDVVIDETAVISPGPLSSIDPYLTVRGPIYRSLQPQERDHPFTGDDPVVPVAQAARRAVAGARGHRIFLATDVTRGPLKRPLDGYRLRAVRRWPGIFGVEVRMYARGTS